MKTAIIVFVLIGLVLCGLAKWSESRETNPDDYASAFVMMGGFASLSAAVVLTVLFGLFRLFFS